MIDTCRPQALDIGVFGVRGIPSTYGGYETFLTALLPELVNRGHAVTVYARGRSHSTRAYRGVRVLPVGAIYRQQFETVSASLTSGAHVAVARHDVALACNVANSVGIGLPRITGIPVALNTDGLEWTRSKWSPFAQKVFHLLAKLGTVTATHLITDCREMSRVYESEFGAMSSVIPYCWTELEPAPPEKAPDLPPQYAVCAGRFVPENHLVEIAKAWARGSIPAPLLVLGDAPYSDALNQELRRVSSLCPDRIHLVGHVEDRATYARIVGDADLYIHGHSVGGINPALVEAMGLGANVLALDTPFNREALGPGGRYFSGFTTNLDAAVRDSWDRREDSVYGRALSERAQREFALSLVAEAYESVLMALAHGQAPSPTRWEHAPNERNLML